MKETNLIHYGLLCVGHEILALANKGDEWNELAEIIEIHGPVNSEREFSVKFSEGVQKR